MRPWMWMGASVLCALQWTACGVDPDATPGEEEPESSRDDGGKDAGESERDCGTSCAPRDPQDAGASDADCGASCDPGDAEENCADEECGSSACGADGACVVPCDSGATNPPECDTCPSEEVLHEGVCQPACANEALDPPACELCGPGRVLREGLCRDLCENGATDPPDCVTCKADETFFEEACHAPCENGAFSPPACDACEDPLHDPEADCAACLPSLEGYPHCSCASPLHDPAEQCAACVFPFAGYPSCTQCVDDQRDPQHQCFTEEEKLEHLIDIRLRADHAIYECETPRGDVYFRYAYGAENLERDTIHFDPVHDESAPKEGCKSPSNTTVSGRQACVFFESGSSRWSLFVGGALELPGLPETITQRLATGYDCDHDELQEGVTPEICKAEYTCTLYTFNVAWPEKDEDGDGVANADDCAPADPHAWKYVAGFEDVDDDEVPVAEMELLCIGEELPRGYVAEMGPEEDNCPNYYNPEQADADGDGIGDPCDVDELSSASQQERIEHMLRLRREADHKVYECDTAHGSVYFRYAYGMEGLSANYMYFYPVYGGSSPSPSCVDPDLRDVQGRQSCVYFDSAERWSLYVGDPLAIQELPRRLFKPIATRYDCENGDRSSGVTYEECAGDHVCNVFLPDPSWLSRDDDDDGVDNAEDCAPEDETRWQYLVINSGEDGGTPAEEDIEFVCAGDAATSGM